MSLAFGVSEGVRVRIDTEPLHHSVGPRETPIWHIPHEHMGSFGMQVREVPEIVVRSLSLWNFNIWFRLRGVDQVCELDGVLNEEDWDVIADDIPIALLGVELDGKPSHVSHRMATTPRPKYGRETKEDRRISRSVSQKPRIGHVCSAFIEFEGSECTGPTCMNNSFWDTLVVETEYFQKGQSCLGENS